MNLTDAESSLVQAILTGSFNTHIKRAAGKIAELRPDGAFSVVQNKGMTEPELRFRYKLPYKKRGDGEKTAIFTVCVHAQREKPNRGPWAVQLHYRRITLQDEPTITSDSTWDKGRLCDWKIDRAQCVVEEELEIDDEIDFMLRKYELSVLKEAKASIIRIKSKADRAATRKDRTTDALETLRAELFDAHNLHGNERARKLFDYVVKGRETKLTEIKKQFQDMAHIVI